uniref:Uncharacterized protein n=1 Tax=Panagrolaimus davidi TaxID=227884 RepID=A0A914QEG8_9BILA
MDNSGNTFDLFIATSKIKLKSNKVHFDTRIRIRCVKNDTDRGLITPEAEKLYNNFADEIRKYCDFQRAQNPELTIEALQEEAFEKLNPIILSNPSTPKVLAEKLRNFSSALDLLCNPKNGCYQNIPVNEINPKTGKSKCCRFYQKAVSLSELKDTTWHAKLQRDLSKANAFKYRDCQILKWSNCNLFF